MANQSYQVLRGLPNTPKDDWELYLADLTDDPEYIQEMYVRRPNFDEMWRAKAYKMDLSTVQRYTMRRTPPEQDYVKRFADRGDAYVPFMKDRLPNFYYAELVDNNVLFYAQIDDARKDKRSQMSFCRFLRVQMGYQEAMVAQLCDNYGIPYGENITLHFAETEEDIMMVYREGPSSCMAGPDKRHQQAVRAYAKAPIAVAYLKNGDDITARVLVRTDTKEYIRYIYGDRDRLKYKLDKEGYTCDSHCMIGLELNGAAVDAVGWPYFDFPYTDIQKKGLLNPTYTII